MVPSLFVVEGLHPQTLSPLVLHHVLPCLKNAGQGMAKL